MTAHAAVKATPGLDAYMEALENRLRETVGSHPGTVADAGAQALAAGGKRLRPLLVFLTATAGHDPLPAGAAVELVHMASLVHDDLIDRAALRRGQKTAWRTHGSVGARATGDYLFARAFSELSATGDAEGVQLLAERRARPRPRRGPPARAGAQAGHDRGRVPPNGARSRLRNSSGPRVCSEAATRRSADSGSRSASPSRSRTTSSTAPVRPSRPGSSRGTTCARERRRCR